MSLAFTGHLCTGQSTSAQDKGLSKELSHPNSPSGKGWVEDVGYLKGQARKNISG